MFLLRICPWIGLFIVIRNEVIQAAPIVSYGDEDIMVGSSRLHREMERASHQVNSIPDIQHIPHYRRESARIGSSEEDSPPLVVNLKIDSDEEEEETKYVDLFINTKRNYK